MYNSVESVFNESVIEDIEEEAYEAEEYADAIDTLAGLCEVNNALLYVKEGVSDSMIDALLGDDEVTKMLDDEIAQDDIEEEEDEDELTK